MQKRVESTKIPSMHQLLIQKRAKKAKGAKNEKK